MNNKARTNANKTARQVNHPVDEATPEKFEKLDQQRMDNESPAAKDAPPPGEHLGNKVAQPRHNPAADRPKTKRRK